MAKNIVIVGGGYIGTRATEFTALKAHATHRIILIEGNTHFQHLFAFPRHAVVPGLEHAAFIPYTNMFAHVPGNSTSVVRARVTGIYPNKVILDRGDPIPYDFLVMAMGTRLAPPGSLETETKLDGIEYFRKHQEQMSQAQNIVIVGGGALGVQMAMDTKERYSTKSVTLVHSRDRLMNTFHPKLHAIVMARAKELGITVVLGSRTIVPKNGFPNNGSVFDVELTSGEKISSDLTVLATGQTPLSEPLRTLSPTSITPVGFISVKRSLQIADDRFPNVFAVGDIADTTNQKAARPGALHAQVVAENISRIINGKNEPLQSYEDAVKGIHMSLGLTRSVLFRNPPTPDGDPFVKFSDDGSIDVGSRNMWATKAPGLTDFFV